MRIDSSSVTTIKIENNVNFLDFSAFNNGGAIFIQTPTQTIDILSTTTFMRGNAKNGACIYMSTTTVLVDMRIYNSEFSIVKATHKGSFLFISGNIFP